MYVDFCAIITCSLCVAMYMCVECNGQQLSVFRAHASYQIMHLKEIAREEMLY